MKLLSRARRPRRRRSGLALVITLAMVALVTVAILAFFSLATSSRRVESSRASRTKADLLAQTGGVHALEQILREITNPNASAVTTVSGTSIYTPLANTNAVPRRLLAPSVPLADARYWNLVRQSVPGADPDASADATASPARDGRYIDMARWNGPALLTGGGFQDATQLPHWVYLQRTSGATNAPSNEAIGRFAYNVYNIGGLLNANAAGYRGGAGPDEFIHLKATQTGADLTRLNSTVSQSDVTKLTAFRDLNTPTLANFVDSALGAASGGLLSTAVENVESGGKYRKNYFTTRQDLLRYCRTQNADLQAIAPALTHFSRSVNAPSWTPTTAGYTAGANTPTSVNRNLPNVRFPSDATIAHYNDDGAVVSYEVKTGDSLLQRRFSLARIGWLTPTGPSHDHFNQVSDGTKAIQDVFGLRWNAASERWDYCGAENTPQSAIKTLADIAAEPVKREPNFFELLKAGILDGSVGSAIASPGPSNMGDDYLGYAGSEDTRTIQQSKDLQILRIGASIVDAADDDNYPTVVALSFAGIPVEVAGVEDLPYLYSVTMAGLREQDGVSPNNLRLLSGDIVWVPIFLNPHQPSSEVISSGPAAVRMKFGSGVLTKAEYNGAGAVYYQTMTKDLTTIGAVTIPSQPSGGAPLGFADFRAAPRAMISSDVTEVQRLDRLATYIHPDTGAVTPNIDTALGNVLGLRLFSWQTEYTGSGKLAGAANWYLKTPSSFVINGFTYYTHVQQVNIVMQYKSPRGNWKTYTTMGGNEAIPSSGMNGTKNDGVSSPGQVIRCGHSFNEGGLIKHDLDRAYNLTTYDPRTSRFSPSIARFWDYGALPVYTYPMGGSYGHSGTPPARFPEGGKGPNFVKDSFSVDRPTNYPDADGVYRPADGYLDGTQANPYRQISGSELVANHPSRPIVLQRPFQSVAELGYVFRDAPFKSLSFFDETSADGALLDLFSIAGEPAATASRLDVNSLNPLIKESLLSQTGQNTYTGQTPYTPNALSSAAVTAVASAYAGSGSGFAFAGGAVAPTVPRNAADLASFMSSAGIASANLDVLKWRRESVVRSLADVSQTRTWNFLIDVIAQSGRFPGSATDAGKFVVEGEQRYWWCVAVDRFTGRVVAQQLESVNE